MRYTKTSDRFSGSATDLANHSRCQFLTHLSRRQALQIANNEIEPPTPHSLALEKGRQFEAHYVAALVDETTSRGGRFIDIADSAPNNIAQQKQLLAEAMHDGVELIAQAPLQFNSIFGYADLLERVSGPTQGAGSANTQFRYEPVEIKYARSVRPAYVLQVCAYASAMHQLQGELPTSVHIITGDSTRHTLPTDHYVEYFTSALERFNQALGTDLHGALDRVPDQVSHCSECDFLSTCSQLRADADHLSLVARIRTDQRHKLGKAGISTLTDLATTSVDHVPGIGRQTLPQLIAQARLQLESRTSPSPPVEYRMPNSDQAPGMGFAMIPPPNPDDMFFDFEGYPYHESGALEYLWGWTSQDRNGARRFDYLWANDPAEEGLALTQFLDEVYARLEQSPGMHVFHYAPYEITALRRLVALHPHEMPRLDHLLRNGVFVDLYAVVRQSMLIGVESYSIKKLEPLYGVSREGDDLADGGASIEVFEQWLNDRDSSVRDTIIDYNRVDCESTLALRDWLLQHAELAAQQGIEWPKPPTPEESDAEDTPSEELPSEPDPRSVTIEGLAAVAADTKHALGLRRAAEILSVLPGWQRRIDREFYGELFGFQNSRDPEDWREQSNALAPLTLRTTESLSRGSVARTYHYPPQVSLVSAGQRAIDPARVATCGEVTAVDDDADTVTIKTIASVQDSLDQSDQRSGRITGGLPSAIVGHSDVRTFPLEKRALDVGAHLLASLESGRDPYAAHTPNASVIAMLSRRPPSPGEGHSLSGLSSTPTPEYLADVIAQLDGSYLVIQGPPGTGKTWTAARIIADLASKGMKVGISSNSHAAIVNVLEGVDTYRKELMGDSPGAIPPLSAAYAPRQEGPKADAPSLGFGDDWISLHTSSKNAAQAISDDQANILAGTAWQMAKAPDLDVMIIDEAGQVSLLHAVAMAACAQRTVLIGDPQQLAQPNSVRHPAGCDASILQHIFDGAETVPSGYGVLLPESRRMHRSIAEFIGKTYYASRVHAHPTTDRHSVSVDGHEDLSGAGLRRLEIAHENNRVQSMQEAEAIRDLVEILISSGRVISHHNKPERKVCGADILVVAPYNAQRKLLTQLLPKSVAVGTVDKFQGQEAPIAILSMTASSTHDLPRGLEFLLDPHRLNVAVSRARALAILVASPTLLDTPAATLSELRMLNDLARFRRAATPIRLG